MPLLDFSVPDDQSPMLGRFWIYLAFTVPLTLLTLVCYVVYTLLHEKRHKKEAHAMDTAAESPVPQWAQTDAPQKRLGPERRAPLEKATPGAPTVPTRMAFGGIWRRRRQETNAGGLEAGP